MTIAKRIIEALAVAAFVSSAAAHAADGSIVIGLEEGKQVATFQVGNSTCVLKDDQIRCVPTSK
jgi:hypothetical protein